MVLNKKSCFFPIWAILCILALSAQAAEIPSSADVGRIKGNPPSNFPQSTPQTPVVAPQTPATSPVPETDITLTLRSIEFEGMTAYTPEEISGLYSEYIGRNITVDIIWLIAARLTQKYQSDGYFLSKAYVPAQEIDGGRIKIKVVEAYIDKVDTGKSHINESVKIIIKRLLEERPININTLESNLLKINDQPGHYYKAVLEPNVGGDEASVALNLIETPKDASGLISFSNSGSRFIGPYQLLGSYQDSFFDSQKTTISALTATQLKEIKYGAVNHEFYLSPEFSIELYGAYSDSAPGFTLKQNHVESQSLNLGTSFKYNFLRQRDENLSGKLTFDMRNTNSDLLFAPFTRDRTRVIRASGYYDFADSYNGYNFFDSTISRGIRGLGANRPDEIYLSRAEAEADFTKLEVGYRRLQALSQFWAATFSFNGQIADKPLFSSEEFGYGGAEVGRAYDSSEIAGDHGLSAGVEFRYNGIEPLDNLGITPYAFYDFGAIWNIDSSKTERLTASSLGGGVRLATELGISADLGIAFPLTNEIDNPIYSADGNDPRYIFKISYGF